MPTVQHAAPIASGRRWHKQGSIHTQTGRAQPWSFLCHPTGMPAVTTCFWFIQRVDAFHRVKEPLRLEKTSKFIQPNQQPITPCPLPMAPQCHIHTAPEHLQGQWLHHLPGQPVPLPHCSCWEGIQPERKEGSTTCHTRQRGKTRKCKKNLCKAEKHQKNWVLGKNKSPLLCCLVNTLSSPSWAWALRWQWAAEIHARFIPNSYCYQHANSQRVRVCAHSGGSHWRNGEMRSACVFYLLMWTY